MKTRILIVDDDPTLGQLLKDGLERRNLATRWVSSGDEALATLVAEDVDVVVTDLAMRGMSGIALCQRISSDRPDLPVLVLTAFGSLETAVDAIRAGAYDFISKPVDIDALQLAIDRAAQHRALRQEVKRLRKAVEQTSHFEQLIGASPAMTGVYDLVDRVADSEATVLITGESGTGKELVARALHKRSRRGEGPFVAINCSAIPDALLESQLFGHVRGAFTDARHPQPGLFVQAHGGTLFLDEVGELPLVLQPKILRAIQERTVRPVGGQAEVPFDTRIVAATNRDLEAAVEDKRFREDLFFRIHVISIHMPPLRTRGSDTLLLAQKFLELFTGRTNKNVDSFSPAAAERLLTYPWPGNVRELQNCIEHAVALTRFNQIALDDLPERVRSFRRSHVLVAADNPGELPPMEEVERRYILRVLEAAKGSRSLTAKILGFDRKTLYRKLLRYGVAEQESS